MNKLYIEWLGGSCTQLTKQTETEQQINFRRCELTTTGTHVARLRCQPAETKRNGPELAPGSDLPSATRNSSHQSVTN
jgi:hypothetical protein